MRFWPDRLRPTKQNQDIMRSFLRPRKSKIRTGEIVRIARGKKVPAFSEYAERDRLICKVLRLAVSYEDYLESELWKFIRAGAMGHANGRCQLCGEDATEIHHLSYNAATLQGINFLKKPPEPIKHLLAVCRNCHQDLEFHDDGSKRTFQQMRRRYAKMIKRRKRHI